MIDMQSCVEPARNAERPSDAELVVQVYDTSAHQRIFTIKRPASAARLQHAQPHLYWEADSLLYVGWAATVTVRCGTSCTHQGPFEGFSRPG